MLVGSLMTTVAIAGFMVFLFSICPSSIRANRNYVIGYAAIILAVVLSTLFFWRILPTALDSALLFTAGAFWITGLVFLGHFTLWWWRSNHRLNKNNKRDN